MTFKVHCMVYTLSVEVSQRTYRAEAGLVIYIIPNYTNEAETASAYIHTSVSACIQGLNYRGDIWLYLYITTYFKLCMQ